VYGDSYPFAGVYSPDFWRVHLGKRLTSIVAADGGDIVAHIGLLRPQIGSTDVFAVYSVLDPAYRHRVAEIATAARDTIRRLSGAQSWRSALACIYEAVPTMRSIADGVLRSREVAIVPGYFPSAAIHARGERISRPRLREIHAHRRHGLLTHRVFGPDTHAGAAVYLPERHREIGMLLYAPLGLERRFADQSTDSYPPRSASKSSVERSSFRAHGSHHLLVSPQNVDLRAPLEPRSWDGNAPVYLYVDAFDPRCPAVAEHLENQGYRFAGIVPVTFGRDSVVYFKETEPYVDRAPFPSARARMLSRYIEDYDLRAALDVIVPRDRIITVTTPPQHDRRSAPASGPPPLGALMSGDH